MSLADFALIVAVVVVALGAGVHIVDLTQGHRERMRALELDAEAQASGIALDAVILAIRAAAYRAADPQMGDELVERIIQTVAEDLDAGVLTDPRDATP